MTYKSFDNLPVVKPATAKPNDFHDSLLQRTSQTAEESARLDSILAHYQKGIEQEAKEQSYFHKEDETAVVQI